MLVGVDCAFIRFCLGGEDCFDSIIIVGRVDNNMQQLSPVDLEFFMWRQVVNKLSEIIILDCGGLRWWDYVGIFILAEKINFFHFNN